MKKIILLISILCSIQLSASIWQRAEGPYQNPAVYSIFKFNDTIYTSLDYGVLFKQVGEDWVKVDEKIFEMVGTVKVFVQKDNVAIISGINHIIYVTYDYGKNWETIEKISNGIDGYQSLTIVDETIFCQEFFFNNSLYKLEKGSKKWEKLFLDKEKKDSIYADKLVSDGDFLFAGDMDINGWHKTGGGITVSSDKGKTWSKLDNFTHPVIEMAIHKEKLYVATSENYIYRTSDKGKTWIVDTNLIMPIDHLISDGKNLYAAVNSIASKYDAEYGVLVSTNDGISWEKRSEGLDRINMKEFEILNSKVYVRTDRNKIYETTDNGYHWNATKLLESNINSNRLLLDNDTLFASASFKLYYSTDKGATWLGRDKDLGNWYSMIKKIWKEDSIFVASDQLSIDVYISTNSGKNWELANINGNQGWLSELLILKDKIVALSNKSTTMKNKYTTDFGNTWSDYDDPVFNQDYVIKGVVSENENNILVYTNAGLLSTKDNGITWEMNKVDTNIKVSNIKKYRGNLYGMDLENNIFETSDFGVNWKKLEFNWENNYRLNYYFIEDNLVIPIFNGIEISSDNGKTFKKYYLDSSQMDTKPILFNDVIEQDDYIICTSTTGIWRAKLSDLGIVKSSVESETERNYLYTYPPYPLPAKSEVKVLFFWDINIPMTVDDISIYDLSGQKIEAKNNLKLIKQESHYGNIIWDCSTTPAGIYIINIKHGTESKSVKVVVE